jgi:hypothetical protein
MGDQKMKSTLSELWRGNIHPDEGKTENEAAEKELRSALDKCYDLLWMKLDDEGKLTLDQLRSTHSHLSSLGSEDAFIRGFSLAVKMLTEAITQ